MFPLKGTVNKPPNEQVLRTVKSIPSSEHRFRIPDKSTLKSSSRSQKPDFRSEGTSSNSGKAAISFSNMAAPEEERKAPIARRKKLKKKYFCFFPF